MLAFSFNSQHSRIKYLPKELPSGQIGQRIKKKNKQTNQKTKKNTHTQNKKQNNNNIKRIANNSNDNISYSNNSKNRNGDNYNIITK